MASNSKRFAKLDMLLLLHFVNLIFSFVVFIIGMRHSAWPFAVFGPLSLVALFLRLGWSVPTTVLGIYLGTFVLQPIAQSGSLESQIQETLARIGFFTFAGFVVGLLIDLSTSSNSTARDTLDGDQ